jgi:Protein of unknown function (DUF4232)
MTERWQAELRKLREVPQLPDDLWRRVEAGPRLADHGISPRSRVSAVAVASAGSIAVLLLIWLALRPFERSVRPEATIFDVPPAGTVAPALLSDGRPVFVVHLEGGVGVVDAGSTDRPWGIGALVAWCPSSRTFDDLFHGARWSAAGSHLTGPADGDLTIYRTTTLPNGRVRVAQAGVSARLSVMPASPRFCETPAAAVLPLVPTPIAISPSGVVGAAPGGWVTIRALLAVQPSGARLCSISTWGPGCADGAPVEGIDVHGMLAAAGTRLVTIPGTFIARVDDGSFADLTLVPTPTATCATSQLTVAEGGRISEATEQESRLFRLTNVSSRPCTLEGYPRIVLLDANGAPIPFRYHDGGDQMVTSRPPSPVELAPGGSAYLLINQTACVTGGVSVASSIRITPPGSDRGLTVSLRRYPIIESCGPGTVVDVSPVEATPRAVLPP